MQKEFLLFSHLENLQSFGWFIAVLSPHFQHDLYNTWVSCQFRYNHLPSGHLSQTNRQRTDITYLREVQVDET